MRTIEITLTSSQKLDAINWAAGCAGQTYGKFSQHLNEEQVQQIYLEYQQELSARKLALEARSKLRKNAARPARSRP